MTRNAVVASGRRGAGPRTSFDDLHKATRVVALALAELLGG